jgi:hypothetical protein
VGQNSETGCDTLVSPLQTKPVSESAVALISSAGIALKIDRPFDQRSERQNSWQRDPSYRILPRNVSEQDVEIYHLHINFRANEPGRQHRTGYRISTSMLTGSAAPRATPRLLGEQPPAIRRNLPGWNTCRPFSSNSINISGLTIILTVWHCPGTR